MIVVDTSALMAIINAEPGAPKCLQALQSGELVISAGTLAEAFIVAAGRKITAQMTALIEGLDFEIVPVDTQVARRVGTTYAQWGKGIHPAGLNFGDCFAYALAKERNCPLLYVGNDFSQTDIVAAG